jgi:hypothetical protein
MKGVEDRQQKMLAQRKEILIEKRRRRAEREIAEARAAAPEGTEAGELAETAGVLAATS